MKALEPVSLGAIRTARARLSGQLTHTPLLRLNLDLPDRKSISNCGKIDCVVSGGNIDAPKLAAILDDRVI